MLSKIIISSFRGIINKEFPIGKKTYITGYNGSGKTHILDAIHLLTGAKNIYGNTKLDGGDRIEALFGEEFQEKSYIFGTDRKKEQFFIHSKKYTKPKFQEALPFRTVYVSPFDMNILYFAPAMRREYLDDILARAYGQFSKVRREYEQIMRQRNALLKKIREQEARQEDLIFWDKKFAELALQYGLYRKKYIEYITRKMSDFPAFFRKYPLQILYTGKWLYEKNPEQYIVTYLEQNRERDIFSGHTHIGPHRDDFIIVFYKNNQEDLQEIQFFLSRGETKMILLGMKIIESDFIQEQTQKSVILLVDDIFAELDEKNIGLFLKTIIQHQIILTSQKDLPSSINSQDYTCIKLTNGYNDS